MDLHEEFRELLKRQSSIIDGYRLFHDGTVKTARVTDSLETGWYVLAGPIAGVSRAFRHYFPASADGLFLKVEGMRQAIAIRDKMLEVATYSRIQREFEMSIQNNQPSPGFGLPDSL